MLTIRQGLYCLFEGCDFSGKSSLSKEVYHRLSRTNTRVQLTAHPGATPLGRHLRVLSKTPHTIDPEIEIDPLSRQMLMFIDQVCFIKTILTPFLESGGLMLADRSNYVSGIVYGTCAGVDLSSLNRMFKIAQSPAPDVMFILSAPLEVLLERRAKTLRQTAGDVFDHNTDFLEKVATTYDNLLSSSDVILIMLSDYMRLGDIVYLDATKSTEELADEVMAKISQIQDKRRAFESPSYGT